MKLKSIKCVIASAVLLCGALTGIFTGCITGGESGVSGKTTLLKYEESDLLVALVDYLKDLNADHDMPPTSFSAKIDQIKGGKQALYTDFNSSESYFVGGYYNGLKAMLENAAVQKFMTEQALKLCFFTEDPEELFDYIENHKSDPSDIGSFKYIR